MCAIAHILISDRIAIANLRYFQQRNTIWSYREQNYYICEMFFVFQPNVTWSTKGFNLMLDFSKYLHGLAVMICIDSLIDGY